MEKTSGEGGVMICLGQGERDAKCVCKRSKDQKQSLGEMSRSMRPVATVGASCCEVLRPR